MRGRFAPFLVGAGLVALACVQACFAIYAALAAEPWLGFTATAATAAAFGVPLAWTGSAAAEPSRREALLAVLLLWLIVPLTGAIPYTVSGGMSLASAIFESMSGFTATGATAILDFDALSPSLFLWRGLTQWFGGIGIIVLFIAVLPQLAIAGRQLFFAEVPGPTDDRLAPRLRTTAGAVITVYLGLTALCCAAYLVAGQPAFDAVVHAFTTVAAAGFSPEPRSFESFSPVVHWVAIVFMMLAGVNFVLQFRVLQGRPHTLLRDREFRAYLAIIGVGGTLVTLFLLPEYALVDAVRHGFFQVLSILTTTGYASVDYGLWEPRAQVILLVLMFVGGSAGSAAGGVKIVRWLIIGKNTAREVRRSLHPRGVFPVRIGERIVPEEVLRSVAAFITLYVGLFAFSTVVLVVLGADFVTGTTASMATIGNVGPGLGEVGPMGSYGVLHPASQALLSFNMYAGRLEILTVFVLAAPSWWVPPRRRRGGTR